MEEKNMLTEEVVNTVEEISPEESRTGSKLAVCAVLATLVVGGVVCTKLVKKAITKIKAKKDAKKSETVGDSEDEYCDSEENEED